MRRCFSSHAPSIILKLGGHLLTRLWPSPFFKSHRWR